ESERRDLDLAGLQRAFDDARIHQIVERVVDRAQIRIDLLAHIAGKESEPLARLDRRTRENDAIDLLALEQLHRVGDREPGFAGARRPAAQDHPVAARRGDRGVAAGGARGWGPWAGFAPLESRPRGRGVVAKQRPRRDPQADPPFDAAGAHLAPAFDLLVGPSEPPPRSLHAVARAR